MKIMMKIIKKDYIMIQILIFISPKDFSIKTKMKNMLKRKEIRKKSARTNKI